MLGNTRKCGAGERIRTVDLRITSAPSKNLTESAESPEARNPRNSRLLRHKEIITPVMVASVPQRCPNGILALTASGLNLSSAIVQEPRSDATLDQT